jgi:hypothetical protein
VHLRHSAGVELHEQSADGCSRVQVRTIHLLSVVYGFKFVDACRDPTSLSLYLFGPKNATLQFPNIPNNIIQNVLGDFAVPFQSWAHLTQPTTACQAGGFTMPRIATWSGSGESYTGSYTANFNCNLKALPALPMVAWNSTAARDTQDMFINFKINPPYVSGSGKFTYLMPTACGPSQVRPLRRL